MNLTKLRQYVATNPVFLESFLRSAELFETKILTVSKDSFGLLAIVCNRLYV